MSEPVELSPDDRAKMIEQIENRGWASPFSLWGGFTPRQAAADPIRREDLVALLAEFDRKTVSENAITFDPDSLRRKLGLG